MIQVQLARAAAIAAVLWFGAVFGFFFAWVCSTMWGLDAIDPRTAIAAMNGMNESVRNPVFFTAFFLAPVVGAAAAVLSWVTGKGTSAFLLGFAVVLYVFGVIVFTRVLNVPLNEGLAAGGVPETFDEARNVWDTYSGRWQIYNLIRAVVSGVCLLIAAVSLFPLGGPSRSLVGSVSLA